MDPRRRAPAAGQAPEVLGVVVLLAQRGDRHRALGLAVELEEDRAHAPHGLGQAGRRRGRRAVEHRLQARQVVLVELRVVEQHVDHRRHEHRGRDAVGLDGLHELLGIEPGEHGQRSALEQGRREEGGAGVGERRADQEADLVGPLPLAQLDRGHGRPTAVGAHDPLGLAGGAARVGDPGEVLGVDGRGHQRLRVEGGGEGVEVLAEVGGPEGQHVLQAGDHVGELADPIGEVVGVVDQGLGAAVGEHVGLVLERAHRVQGRRPGGVELVGRHGEEHLGPVQGQHRALAPRAEPLRPQGLGVAAHLVTHLAGGHGPLADVHRRGVGVLVQRVDQEVGREHRAVELREVGCDVGHGRRT